MELQTPVQEQGVVSWLMVTFSLIPSPFLPPVLVCKTKREGLGNFVPPVLDCLQYAKQRGGRPGKFCHVHCDVICRHMRAVSNEEPLGPSCYILSKCLRPESSKCLVDLKLINTKLVCYDDQPPPTPPVSLPSVYLTPLPVTKSLKTPPSVFAYCKRSKTGWWRRPWNEAMSFLCYVTQARVKQFSFDCST